MSDQLAETEQLVFDAFAILSGDGEPSPHEAGHFLAAAAKKLALALPQCDSVYDPEKDGPPMSPEAIKATAIEVRFFLELISDLFGDSSDPDWTGGDFAFVGTLKKRPGWKQSPQNITPGMERRLAAAKRVYELMANQCFDEDTTQPKQEAAIVAAMAESGLPRSKIMLGLKELRTMRALLGPLSDEDEGEIEVASMAEAMEWAHHSLAYDAMVKEGARRNSPPDLPD